MSGWLGLAVFLLALGFALSTLFPHTGIRRHRIDPERAAELRRAFRHIDGGGPTRTAPGQTAAVFPRPLPPSGDDRSDEYGHAGSGDGPDGITRA